MRIHGKERAYQLRQDKKKNRDIQGGPSDPDFTRSHHVDDPRANDKNSQPVRHHHFVVFKQFIIPRCEDQGNEDEKEDKPDPDDPLRHSGNAFHEDKYTTPFFITLEKFLPSLSVVFYM